MQVTLIENKAVFDFPGNLPAPPLNSRSTQDFSFPDDKICGMGKVRPRCFLRKNRTLQLSQASHRVHLKFSIDKARYFSVWSRAQQVHLNQFRTPDGIASQMARQEFNWV